MRKLIALTGILFLAVGMLAVNTASAANITKYDNNSSGLLGTWSNQGNTPGEDQETEPVTRTGQVWDLEAFLRTGTNLSMVGGYTFNGVTGFLAAAGDVFIANKTTPTYYGTGTPTATGFNIYGYNYALTYNIVGNSGTYSLFKIDTSTAVQAVNYVTPQSDPWKLGTGGTQTLVDTHGWGYTGLLQYSGALTGAQTLTQTGFAFADHEAGVTDDSYNHYIVTFLGLGDYLTGWTTDDGYSAWFHYTYQCGNDSLMGEALGKSVPIPPSALLLGSGLLGLVGLGWRRRRQSS